MLTQLTRWVESAPERVVFWLSFLTYLCFWNPLYFSSVTEVNLHLAWSLAHLGTPELFDYRTMDAAFVDGRVYSGVSPGSGWLAVPIAFLAGGLEFPDAEARVRMLHLLCSLVLSIPLGALTAALLAGLIRRQGVPPHLAAVAGLLFALGTNQFAVALSYNKESFEVFLVVGILACVMAGSGTLTESRSLLAGGLAGAIPLLHYADGMLVAGFMCYVWWTGGWRVLGWFVLGTLPSALLLGLYHTAAFGAPWLTGYHFPRLPDLYMPADVAFRSFSPERLAQVLFGPRGFFLGSPVALLGLVGWLSLSRRQQAWRPLAVLVLGAFAVYTVFYTVYTFSGRGGPFLGWRFLHILLPLLAIGIPEGVRTAPRILTVLLGSLSLAIAYLAAQAGYLLHGANAYVYMAKVWATTLGGGVFFADLLPRALGVPVLHHEGHRLLEVVPADMSAETLGGLLPLILGQLLFALPPLLMWATAAAVTGSLLLKGSRSKPLPAVSATDGEARVM